MARFFSFGLAFRPTQVWHSHRSPCDEQPLFTPGAGACCMHGLADPATGNGKPTSDVANLASATAAACLARGSTRDQGEKYGADNAILSKAGGVRVPIGKRPPVHCLHPALQAWVTVNRGAVRWDRCAGEGWGTRGVHRQGLPQVQMRCDDPPNEKAEGAS